MIELHVSAVLTVCDGFTGRPLQKSAVRVTLDGQPYKPEYRAGGYFVFINLAPGAHSAVLHGSYYEDEIVSLFVQESGRDDKIVHLKPAKHYPFGGKVTSLAVTVLKNGAPLQGACVHVAAPSAFETKFAQETVEAGAVEAKLYIRGNSTNMRLPANCLIVDGKNSECCMLNTVDDGMGTFYRPLCCAHKRGKALYPCVAYMTDQSGRFTAIFREAAQVELFFEQGKCLKSVALQEGENALTFEV